MNLRGVRFKSVIASSGTLNFFGEGWKQHKIFRCIFPRGFNFFGATFVSKTTTLKYQKGNLDLRMNLQPHSWFPDCVRVYPKKGVVLNAAGLSGPGAEYLFSQGLWQKRTEPFLISFMAIGESRDERIMETQRFSELILRRFSEFSTQFGVELNISCPNTAHRLTELFGEVIDQLEGLAELNVPIVLKVDALALIEAVKRVADSGLCDAIAVSNSIPWGELPAKIDWEGIFGSMKSPLEHLGGGGLSGYPLLPIVSNWIAEARRRGVTIPIIGGGGILKKSDVDFLHRQGASAISIGSVALLRPWRVQGIIQHAKRVFGD